MIQFFVACTPRGKQRARVLRSGHSYTPKETVDLERLIAWECKKAMNGQKPLEGPICLAIDARFDVPQSWSAKKREAAHWKTSKPDADNIVKLVKDALNKVAWVDDAQIVELFCRKIYAEAGGGLRINFGKCQ
jgi:Holliday junction resolvase RusA-like endonuclease